jgi:hypothetical protein
MKEFIKEKLVNHHKNCSVDKYGQMSALDFYQIFDKEKGEEVLNYLNDNKGVLNICTYGYRYGTYKGISNILDADIKKACNEAFNNNENRKEAMTR